MAIVGYTNAGKSSLLNRMTKAGVLVQDELFATVDPTVRKARTPSGREFTLSDTVGFVRHLPHQLIESFRSTLEEATEADLLLHVVDGADEAPLEQIAAVREVLADVGGDDVPELIVVNKADVADAAVLDDLRRELKHVVFVSAKTGAGMQELAEALEADLPSPAVEVDVTVGYEHSDLVARVHREGEIDAIEHGDFGTHVKARVSAQLAKQLADAATGGTE